MLIPKMNAAGITFLHLMLSATLLGSTIQYITSIARVDRNRYVFSVYRLS
jgi:predicted thioesterase